MSTHSKDDADAATPTWVTVFGSIAIIVVVAFMILHLVGGGPGRHFVH